MGFVDGESLDGDGYHFEDLTGTGEVDLISNDQDFLYTFAPYASSIAPTRVHRLLENSLYDVTTEPRFYQFLTEELAGIQQSIKSDDHIWHDNGFLAGWVAAKMLVGQGSEAWSRMLTSYDHNPELGPEECTTNSAIETCPDEKRVRVDFPKALKEFLARRKYILDPSLYPVPDRPAREVEQPASAPSAPAPAVTAAPALRQCIDSSDTVRKLIVQSFIGRKLTGGEEYNEVTLESDTTLEETDQNTGKVVCAVTYELALKPLIGRLAEIGDFRRAEVLGRLMRRDGPTASTRVKYSVKPTATEGETFIELFR